MEKSKKRVGVLFSGGLDSTYLVWRNLMLGNEVVPIYIEIKNNEQKNLLEKNRVENLRNLFDKEFPEKISEIVYALSVDVTPSDNLLLKQIPVWILGLIYSQNHGVEELQIGYIGGDDAIAFIDDVKKIYSGFNRLNTKNLKKIEFPLIRETKFEIITKLPEQYRNLLVSCENPKIINENVDLLDYIPCGECPPCQKIIMTNNYYTELSDNYKKIKMDMAFDYIFSQYNKDNIEYNPEYTIIKKESPKLDVEPIQLEIDFGDEHTLVKTVKALETNVK